VGCIHDVQEVKLLSPKNLRGDLTVVVQELIDNDT
jgi:hypothetical protein